jgi:hypothetical protein
VEDRLRRLVGKDMYPGASQTSNLQLHLSFSQSVTFSSSEPPLHFPVAPSSLSLSRGCHLSLFPALLRRNLGLYVAVCCIYCLLLSTFTFRLYLDQRLNRQIFQVPALARQPPRSTAHASMRLSDVVLSGAASLLSLSTFVQAAPIYPNSTTPQNGTMASAASGYKNVAYFVNWV